MPGLAIGIGILLFIGAQILKKFTESSSSEVRPVGIKLSDQLLAFGAGLFVTFGITVTAITSTDAGITPGSRMTAFFIMLFGLCYFVAVLISMGIAHRTQKHFWVQWPAYVLVGLFLLALGSMTILALLAQFGIGH